MAKYSTGGGGNSQDGHACELCGDESERLEDVTIAGAKLSVCQSCAPHDDRGPKSQGNKQSSQQQRTENPGRRAAQHAAKFADAQKGDPDYWLEHGTDYEEDRLPYLVSGYGNRVERARQESGLTIDELAEALDIPVKQIEAVEQNRASRAGVGGSTIRALESEFNIALVDES